MCFPVMLPVIQCNWPLLCERDLLQEVEYAENSQLVQVKRKDYGDIMNFKLCYCTITSPPSSGRGVNIFYRVLFIAYVRVTMKWHLYEYCPNDH